MSVFVLRCLLAILSLPFFAPALFASTKIDLNENWHFRTDAREEGEKNGWSQRLPPQTKWVSLPHTWNLGVDDEHEGVAWYFCQFRAPFSTSNHIELHFGATFYKAKVFLNGTELGTHEGGFTSYYFDITRHLRDVNYLAIRLDNRPTEVTIPGLAQRIGDRAWYDWWHYGGITRDVWLTVSDSAFVRRQRIRSRISANQAVVDDTIHLENVGRRNREVELTAVATVDGSTEQVSKTEKRLILAPGETKVPVSLPIENPKLWDFDHPNLYRLSVTVRDPKANTIDEASDTFGLRTVTIRDRHLYLNGERVRLSGITRHEESPWEGHAETRGTILHDYKDLKSLQVTLTRPVHYPQNPLVLDFADRNGILLIPEIPVWQFTEKQMADPRVIALAKQQMREMVEDAGNHPSIFAWSVCNESETNRPGGITYFKALKEMLNEIDPTRFVTFANNNLPASGNPKDDAAYFADFIMMNQYYGTWGGPASQLGPGLEKVGKDYPDKMLIISEFGAAGFFEADENDGDRLRSNIIQKQMEEIATHDWIAGAVLWCYQDYRSHRNLWPGQTQGPVPMGIVDENRQRKPSYELWKSINFPATIQGEFNDWYKAPTAFTLTVARNAETQIPFYPLRDYRVTWEARDQAHRLLAKGEKTFANLITETLRPEWAPRGDESQITFIVRVYRPTGFPAAERQFVWRTKNSGEQVFSPPAN